MPARRSTAKATSSGEISSSPASPQENDEAYKIKRKRNNDAVKKTREKSKQTAAERKRHVEKLKDENSRLEAKIESEKDNIKLLKDLLCTGVNSNDHERIINEILEAPTDDEDQDDGK